MSDMSRPLKSENSENSEHASQDAVPGEGPGARSKLTVKRAADALIATRGNKQLAAERLGITYKTFSRFEKAHPTIADIVDEQNERRVDRAVIAADQLVAQGFWPAVRYILATLGKNRGYTEKIEVEGDMSHSGPDGGPIKMRVIYDEELLPRELTEHGGGANGSR